MHLRTCFALPVAILLLTAAAGCARSADQQPPSKPNVIFIMADDLGYGDLGVYGQQEIMTPHIDRLAAEGIRFTQVYAGSTVCAPSRSVLMTGLHTGRTRVRGNFAEVGGTPPQGRVPLAEDDLTVAEVMKDAGYATGIAGKWGLGEPGTSGVPTRQGFDEWLGYLNQRNAHSYYPPYLWRNEEKLVLEGNRAGGRETYSHHLFTDFALEFIRDHRDEPFFLYLPYTVPHAAYEIPSMAPYEEESWSHDARVHAAMITLLDRDVGTILDLLEELNLSDETMVFFCSDNGAAQRWEGVFDSSGPLRGRKRDLYEGGIRTPMIVRYPGVIPEGEVSDQVWYFADVLPTLAEIAGVEPPSGLDGESVLPALRGEQLDLDDRPLYWEFYERDFQQAARWRDWKAVRLAPGAPLELYDLSRDLSEENDVSTGHPEVVRRLEEILAEEHVESPHWPSPMDGS